MAQNKAADLFDPFIFELFTDNTTTYKSKKSLFFIFDKKGKFEKEKKRFLHTSL